MNGTSTGHAPMNVNKMKVLISVQNRIFLIGLKDRDLNFDFIVKGKDKIIRIDIISAITPPNLFGIDRRIAYANRKYHSGWMWGGVTKGLAIKKFSGSMNQ